MNKLELFQILAKIKSGHYFRPIIDSDCVSANSLQFFISCCPSKILINKGHFVIVEFLLVEAVVCIPCLKVYDKDIKEYDNKIRLKQFRKAIE